MTIKLKCHNCGTEFEISEDDLDIDYDVDRLEKDSVEITVSVSVRCPKCGRRVLQGSESVTIMFKARGE